MPQQRVRAGLTGRSAGRIHDNLGQLAFDFPEAGMAMCGRHKAKGAPAGSGPHGRGPEARSRPAIYPACFSYFYY
jgi:hypothetical protein